MGDAAERHDEEENLTEEEWEAAWAPELERRVAEIEAGTAKVLSQDEFTSFMTGLRKRIAKP